MFLIRCLAIFVARGQEAYASTSYWPRGREILQRDKISGYATDVRTDMLTETFKLTL